MGETIDRAWVVNGLTEIAQQYEPDGVVDGINQDLIKDALKLLLELTAEQKPARVKRTGTGEGDFWSCYCSECGGSVKIGHRYCHWCGRRLLYGDKA